MKKSLFWDSDGTLLYGNESFKCSLMDAFSEFSYSLDESVAKSFLRSVCSWYAPEMDHSDKKGAEWWMELLDKISVFCGEHEVHKADIAPICHAFRRNVIDYPYEAYADAKEVLHYFKKKGYENYIISNNFPELPKVFERLGLDTEIDGYFLSACVGYDKPRKEIFQYALVNTGNPERKYMIGDNPVADYQGGQEAGMISVLVHNAAEGKLCCDKLTDLFEIIKD